MNTNPLVQADRRLSDLALALPGAARVFHRHGLDFCCGGRATLSEACADQDLDLEQVLRELSVEPSAGEPAARWVEAPLAELVEHVLERYHAGHREELPRLVAMAEKVERVHADKSSCPHGLAAHLQLIADSMEEHMQKEEQVLFPMLLAGRGRMAAMPITCMREEHDDHGRNFVKLRALAQDYAAPAEACATWRALYQGIEQFVIDGMEHVALENNVLFQRALSG
ncbi:iron-sulfur cluster repair protein YtfE [Engelhardtia mirabilis]|uniref:Iron-sulfur cluster repair protein YtfE n=1 Tax=Engelhardtia mirabilis TaxID=2528011 RepID=A0A518BDB5_9BACT|nr:Iron-sulfur cluster repair protein YtfE [Planctomycetes bacterium Pla133]QDU99304.1 Iron-sulfur cluster repair protein YtfE [Planctomycetes bacterium Pla86]